MDFYAFLEETENGSDTEPGADTEPKTEVPIKQSFVYKLLNLFKNTKPKVIK